MFEDFEAVKIVALFALFVVLVLVAILISVRDAQRQRRQHEERVKQQIDILKRAKAEAELRRQQAAQASGAAGCVDSFRPSDFAALGASQGAGDRTAIASAARGQTAA